MNRHENRIKAIEYIFQMLINGWPAEETMKAAFENDDVEMEGTYAMELIEGISAKSDKLIKVITMYIPKGWTWNRQNFIDKAILLVATYEILSTDAPKQAIINEAVSISKKYSDDDKYKFINAVLDKIERR